MKIRAERSALADALTWVSQAISKKPMNVVLSGVRIVASGEHITLSAFDYDVSHEARVAAEVVGEGECLVSAAFVRSIVASMRAKDVELVLDGDVLTISSGKAAYTTRTLKIEDYPTLPPSPPTVGTIEAGDLLAGLGEADLTAPSLLDD
jgi:DNA polymerase-3 subunit beta